MATTCPFCALNRNSLFCTEHGPFFIILDRHPVAPGHGLVIPKRHIMYLEDFTEEESRMLVPALVNAKRLLREKNVRPLYEQFIGDPVSPRSSWYAHQALENPHINQKPHGINYGLNEGEAAGQTVDHLHWHMMPRYFGDVADPCGGVRNVFPHMGNYRAPPPVAEPPPDLSEFGEGEEDIRASEVFTQKVK